MLETMIDKVVAANGVKPDRDTDAERFYMSFNKPGENKRIENMFNAIKRLAEAQNARDN